MKRQLRFVDNLLEKNRIRQEEQKFVVEGPHLVAEAENLIDFVLYSEELPLVAKLKKKGLNCFKVTKKQFADVSQVETPQGVLAVVNKRKFELEDIVGVINPMIVFCVGIQDPGNLGTIIRTADAVSASAVILSRGTVDLYNSKVIRSTMGSIFHLPIVPVDDIAETVKALKSKHIKIVAADINGEK